MQPWIYGHKERQLFVSQCKSSVFLFFSFFFFFFFGQRIDDIQNCSSFFAFTFTFIQKIQWKGIVTMENLSLIELITYEVLTLLSSFCLLERTFEDSSAVLSACRWISKWMWWVYIQYNRVSCAKTTSSACLFSTMPGIRAVCQVTRAREDHTRAFSSLAVSAAVLICGLKFLVHLSFGH